MESNLKVTSQRYTSQTDGSVPVLVIIVVAAIFAAAIGINLLFVGKPWLATFNMFCWIAGPVTTVGVLLLYLFVPQARQMLTTKTSGESSEYKFYTVGNRRIPRSAVRPEVYGESYNSNVSKHSTPKRLLIVPLWRYHKVSAILVVFLATGLILTALIDSVDLLDPEASALLPENTILLFFASIPEGFKFFIYLFGLIGLMLMLNGLRKPLRYIELNRLTGRCQISKHWLFGFFKKPIHDLEVSKIKAVQLISYTDKEAATKYSHQTGKKGGSYSKHPRREYELNLVMDDGDRINLINHRYKRGVLRDTDLVQEWLSVPLINQL